MTTPAQNITQSIRTTKRASTVAEISFVILLPRLYIICDNNSIFWINFVFWLWFEKRQHCRFSNHLHFHPHFWFKGDCLHLFRLLEGNPVHYGHNV